MLTTYNLRVLHESDSTLAKLVADGYLLPVHGEDIQGANGVVYRPSADLLERQIVAAMSDLEFQIGPGVLSATTYALPPEEYMGLLLGSPGYRQHQLGGLIGPLTSPMTASEQQEWRRQLTEAIRVEARPDSQPGLLPTLPQRPAVWLPEQTRLIHGAAGWLLCLAFETPKQVPRMTIKRSAAGIDVGLRTLAVASHKSGLIHRAKGVTEVPLSPETLAGLLPHRPDLWDRARRMSVAIQHAAAREQLAQFLDLLIAGATVVGYERLTYGGMQWTTQRRSRELGLRDFLAVWLPKRLHQHGLTGQAVTPDLTSVICNRTYQFGERDERGLSVVTDGVAEIREPDENSAANICDLALAHLLMHRTRRKRGG